MLRSLFDTAQVKTNVGHGEASSAMASIIKVVLALETKTIPATIGIQEFNPKSEFASLLLTTAN